MLAMKPEHRDKHAYTGGSKLIETELLSLLMKKQACGFRMSDVSVVLLLLR